MSNGLELVGELILDGLTERYSVAGLVRSTAFYEPRILAFGDVLREVSVIPGEFRASDSGVELDNTDGHFSDLRASYAFRNRRWRYVLGDPSLGESDFEPIFEGVVSNWSLDGNIFRLQFSNIGFPRLIQTLGPLISTDLFPDLPESTPRAFIPVVIGIVSNAGITDSGALPAYLVDPAVSQAKYRYVAAKGDVKEVTNVYLYGALLSPAAYTVTTATYGSDTYTVVDFATDQRDGNRPRELEITWDGDGLKDGLGNSIGNPADQLQTVLLEMGFAAGDLNTATFTNVKTLYQVAGISGGFVAAGCSLLTILQRFAQSFNISTFMDRDGKVGITVPETTPDVTPSMVRINEDEHIVRDSLELQGQTDLSSGCVTEFARNWALGPFEDSISIRDVAQEAQLGERIDATFCMPYIRDVSSANRVSQDRLYFMEENRQVGSVIVEPGIFKQLEIGDYFVLTHFGGIPEAP